MGTFVGRLHYGTVLLGIDWIDARHLRVRTDTDPEYPEREVEGIAIDWQVARR